MSGRAEPREAASGDAAPSARAGDESQVSAPGVRLREVSYFLCVPGQAAEPRAANPKEVRSGGGQAGEVGRGGGGRSAQATFRCNSFANLHDFNIKST